MENIKLVTPDELGLSTAIFSVKNPKAILQIIHGAKEHKERYFDLANYLQKNDIMVVISDLRGHGKSINENYPLGYMRDINQMVNDQVMITNYLKQQYPEVKISIYGHSFGSMIARSYLQKNDKLIDKLILSGTVNFQSLVNFGMILAKIINKPKNTHKYSKILSKLNFDSSDDISWLSFNEDNIEKYKIDPLTNFKYQNGGIHTIFESNKNLHAFKKYKFQNPNLKILNLVGKHDPITGFEKGINDSLKSLEKIGYKNIKSIFYENMKHEIINEDGKEQVYQDILNFLK